MHVAYPCMHCVCWLVSFSPTKHRFAFPLHGFPSTFSNSGDLAIPGLACSSFEELSRTGIEFPPVVPWVLAWLALCLEILQHCVCVCVCLSCSNNTLLLN